MGKYIEVFVAFDVAKKKHAVAIAEGGGREKFGFSATSRTARCRASERSRDWRADMIDCIFVLKPDQRDMGFIGRSRRSATNAWWSLRL